MTKVLLATDKPFAKVAVDGIKDIFQKAGFELMLLEKYTSQNDFVDAIKNVDAVIIRSDKANKEVIEAGKNLKIIVRAGAGYDNIDLDTCSSKGIVAMNTPGQNSNAVAELALGFMVMAARNNYDGTSGTELLGKKLGIHAYGNIGKLVAKIAKGFGLDVYAYDPFVDAKIIENDGVKVVGSIDELYSTCQYISLHIPANEKTKQSINYNLINKMPKGSTIINTARAEVINEPELLKLMEERPDLKYYSDIIPAQENVFKEKFANRCFFSPKKIGAQTSEANINAGLAAANQIVKFIKTGDTTFKVN